MRPVLTMRTQHVSNEWSMDGVRDGVVWACAHFKPALRRTPAVRRRCEQEPMRERAPNCNDARTSANWVMAAQRA
eukprot:267565-Alexandrium_andersonii.AAC.1